MFGIRKKERNEQNVSNVNNCSNASNSSKNAGSRSTKSCSNSRTSNSKNSTRNTTRNCNQFLALHEQTKEAQITGLLFNLKLKPYITNTKPYRFIYTTKKHPLGCSWCRWPDSNRHGSFPPRDFKSLASAISPHRHIDIKLVQLPI